MLHIAKGRAFWDAPPASGTGYASRDADQRPGCAERPEMLARRPRTQRPRTHRGVPKRETYDAENRPGTRVIIVRRVTPRPYDLMNHTGWPTSACMLDQLMTLRQESICNDNV